MKKNIFRISALVVAAFMSMTSCTDYLDKSPDSDISETEPYKNFRNFQGFVEELYNGIPAVTSNDYHNSWNLGEDELWEPADQRPLAYYIDQGNFRVIVTSGTYIYGFPRNGGSVTNSDKKGDKGHLWGLAWQSIRKANIGLANLDKLVDATQEERDLIEGQLLFFRGWYHFMLMQYWGGLPYIDHELPAGETPKLPRLSYQECAEMAAADFHAAAKLLPIDWDQTTAGRLTLGNNNMRANKIMALAYEGKNLLWAGSPLMNLESQKSATYNAELCKRAADAIGEALALTESTGRYELAPFSQYSDLFYLHNGNGKLPGLKETMFQENLVEFSNRWRWNQVNDYRPQLLESSGVKVYPTANYVDYYGMKNGYPIEDITVADKESGYDPAHPFKDRDPRFYHDIVFDGVQTALDPKGNLPEGTKYASLYTDGEMRAATSTQKECRTGYMFTKFLHPMTNGLDNTYKDNNVMILSLMRLADVYLLYAEATANGYGTPGSSSPKFGMTAVEAVNKVRARAGVDPVIARYTSSTDAFMSEVRRERAVELSFEGHRFIDLRRWLLIAEKPYTLKKAVYFDRTSDFSYSKPSEARVANLREEVLVERKFDSRHNWLPLPEADVNIYPEFGQNPGW